MNDEDKCRIIEVFGYDLSKFFFRYLGVSISLKRLIIVDCDFFIEKIILRIWVWGFRYMSYIIRFILVNMVLLNLYFYWVFIFVIFKVVIKKIIIICRNFMWDGKIILNRSFFIVWDIICKYKSEGGLGIKDCEI